MTEYNKNQVFERIAEWMYKNDWKSYDPTDLNSISFILQLKKIKHALPYGKYFTDPFLLIAKYKQDWLRKFYGIKRKRYPQAHSMLARGFFLKFQKTNEKKFLKQGIENLQFLKNNAIESEKYFAWGQPYMWFSKKIVPANTPRTTVTTQTIQAFLDGYELTGNKEFLNIAISASWFLLKGMNWDIDTDGDYCISYTPLDNYHIHNANMLAAAALIRSWYHSGINEFYDSGLKAVKFTSKHQNNDGSWFYWASPDPIKGKIDNYHTGFNLESYLVIRKYLKENFSFEQTLTKGARYYIDNFFEKGKIPKMTPRNLYPIDIQSCAQSVITLAELRVIIPAAGKQMKDIMEWVVKEMYNPNGYFYYRIYKSGKVDKTPYIRWGQSWMLRALAYFEE